MLRRSVALSLGFVLAGCGGDDHPSTDGDPGGSSGTGGGAGVGGATTGGAGAAAGAGGVGGVGGSGATAGAGGSGGAAPSKAGVLVRDSGTSMVSCERLCTEATEADASDQATENGSPCVVPGTKTAEHQSCTVGQSVKPSVAGVVVADNTAGTVKCSPLCSMTLVADEDDWSYENDQSCVIPGTLTGKNQPCMTGEPELPPPLPRPGIIVSVEDEAACVSLCRFATEATAENSDWAYEDNASCVLPGTTTATGRRDCTFGVEPDYTPPKLTGTKVADGFYTKDGRLLDAYGGDFVIRGVNNAHAWFDGYAQYYAWFALDNIQSLGTNTIRVVWDTKGSPALLADVLHRIVELKMVPMVELHDTTGIRADAKLIETAAYWTKPEVLAVLQQFREYLLVNIANEWSGGETYQATYTTVIGTLRSAGIEHTLVIDASGFGQNAQQIFDSAEPLLAADPEHNLLFSLHMYDLYADAARVDSVLDQAASMKIPFIVGEFGHQLSGTDVAWAEIMAKCQEHGLGYLAWSWMGNDMDTAQLDMAEDWEGPLTPWGEDAMGGPNGISMTSHPASIFE